MRTPVRPSTAVRIQATILSDILLACVFCKWASVLIFALGTLRAQAIAVTGPAAPELAAYDRAITSVMTRYGIPAAELAVTRNGKLVLAHGYGTLDPGGPAAVQPDSLFRIASLSKQITAVTILRLWDQKLIDLDRSAFSYLPDLQPLPGKQQDSRIAKITVRNLLQHSGGWDTNISIDPMDQTVSIAQDLGKTAPASSEDLIRAMLGRPLDFDPGARFSYSNFGYCVLGRIIERVTGMKYEQYVRTTMLAPLGIERMRTGNTLQVGRLPGEVAYVSSGTTTSVFPFGPKTVTWPYGGWYLECMDANAGWVASAPDLLKFWNAIDGRRGVALLSQAALVQLASRPTMPEYANASNWYGMGFHISPSADGANWWHDGYLEGIRTLAVRSYKGYDWAVFFNKITDPDYGSQVDSALWDVFNQTTSWPNTDLYPSFATPAVNRPAIQTQDGVMNGASFLRGFTMGSWATIFGINLANTTRIWNNSDFKGSALPLSLDGVTVTVNGVPAAVYYISPAQLNFQIPAGLAAGAVTIEVLHDGMRSGPALGELRKAAPALFTYLGGGSAYAATVFADGRIAGDPAKVPGTYYVKPGDHVSIYGSDWDTGPAGTIVANSQALASLPVVKIGGAFAKVDYAGLTAAGLYQVNLTVPEVSNGNQAVELTYGGGASQKGVVLSVVH